MILGKEGTPPFPYLMCSPCSFQSLVKTSHGVWATCVAQGPVGNQVHVRERITGFCSASCCGCLCLVYRGTSLGVLGRRLGAKENVLLGRAGSKLDRKWVWGTEVYLRYLKVGSFHKEAQNRHPSSNFPLPIPRARIGLGRMPLVCWSSVVCHPFKCSHFQVTILSLALPQAERVWHTGLTFKP